jgi:5-methylcytosine-specific restriction endonuclease McrA
MIELFSRLSQIKFAYKGKSVTLSEDVALAVARFVIRNYPGRVDDVVELYRKSGRIRNDIPSWKLDFNKDSLQTHKRFIVAYLDEGLWLDPRRFFDDSEKDAIIKRDGQQCAHMDEATGIRCTESQYKVLQVDHIKPWSLGGRTDIDNAQLLCDKHNGSKGAR